MPRVVDSRTALRRGKFVACLLVGFSLHANAWLRADCNANDVDDLVDIQNGLSDDCNANGIPDECDVTATRFRVGISRLRVARFPQKIRVGDLDGDGDVDVVSGNRSTSRVSSVSVLLNQGDSQYAAATGFDAGMGLADFVLDDLNGDGSLDVAVANVTDVSVLLGGGDGTFGGATPFSPDDSSARAIVTGDVTGDGIVDMITANADTSTCSVLPGVGDGAFGEAQKYGTGELPEAIVAVDLDGDGDLDVASANRNAASVSVLLNDGSGVFAAAEATANGAPRPSLLLAGDFDQDGDADLVTATTNDVSVFSNVGAARFGSPVSFGFVNAVSAVAAADADRDGDQDLFVTFKDAEKIALIRSTGGAVLRGFVESHGDIPPASSVAAADLDDDGDIDLAVVVTRDVAILVNDKGGGPQLSFSAASYPNSSEAQPPHTLGIGDVDGDGHIDVVTGNNDATNGISIFTNQGDGTFVETAVYSTGAQPMGVEPVDLNGDGARDLAIAAALVGRSQVVFNNGDGTFGEILTFETPGTTHMSVGDLNGDERVDLISTGGSRATLIMNAGGGSFDQPRPLAVGSGSSASTVVDLDGDADLDIATSNRGASSVSVLLNEGDATFSPRVDYQVIGTPLYISSGDLDMDGQVDLVTANLSDVTVFWNAGDGTFEPGVNVIENGAPHSLITADVSGDGLLEVVTADQSLSTSSILFFGGDRSFDVIVPFNTDAAPRFVRAADFDGDGDTDIVTQNWGGKSISVLLNQTPIFSGNYLGRVCTEVDLLDVTLAGSASSGKERVGKYVAPSRDDKSLLPVLFQNTSRFVLHEEFLRGAFPERFGGLTGAEYVALTERRATRDYYLGAIGSAQTERGVVYPFTAVADTGFDAGEVLNLEEVSELYSRLLEVFTLGPLVYEPDTELAKREAETWSNAPFDIFTSAPAADLDYEAYTRATGMGRVRLLSLEEFEDLNDRGRFTFQDILVIAQAPRDIEGVVGGVVTGELQGDLSHVAIRTARRGTPNAFIANALEVFAPYDGKLVRLDVGETEYAVAEVGAEEAEAFWSSNRRELSQPPTFDEEYRALDAFAEMDLESAPVGRYGGKATNLARLQLLLTGEFEQYQERGFAIPVHYYVEFMRSNTRAVDGVEQTYEEWILELVNSADVQSDSERRFEALQEFRAFARDNGVVDADLVSRLSTRIEEVFGSKGVAVRFRSSSNIEDSLEFNGAGLYESTSVCVLDTEDEDVEGPSLCDPEKENERTIERALKRVWSSLWTFRAHEERTFFQIDPALAVMGILVNRAFLDETANGVAFTGNPSNPGDGRFLITSQVGEESVVSPEPGTSVERTFLDVSEGEVLGIFRDRPSSLVPAGEVVVTDAQLRELGAFLWHVNETFPIELEGYSRDQVLLDFEFKVEPDGSLAVKQVRTFLLSEPSEPAPTFLLEVPAGATLCGVFPKESPGRPLEREYATKSQVRLVSGELELPTSQESFTAELFEEVLYGPAQERAVSEGPGMFEVIRVPAGGEETLYRFNYSERFLLATGELLEVRIFRLDFRGRGAEALVERLVLDDAYVTLDLSMEGAVGGAPVVTYSSCGYELLPRYEIAVEIEGGDHLEFVERFAQTENEASTGPAALMEARLTLDGTTQQVNDYWRLVYAATRHNREASYWVVLDPVISVAGLEQPVGVVEVIAPEPLRAVVEAVRYLSADFELLREAGVTRFQKDLRDQTDEVRFRRGDIDADGSVNVGDVLSLLGYVFQKSAMPGCVKAADANDDGRVNLVDAIDMLSTLFQRGDDIREPRDCGIDPTDDVLRCEAHAACR